MTVFLVTGIQAAGKSTVAQALAERFERSVHLRGDLFRRMVVNGRVDMGAANPPAEAIRQLRLRHALTASVADQYADAAFTVIVQDIVLGQHLAEMVAAIRTRPLHVVVLAPRADVVRTRDEERQAVRGKVPSQARPCSPSWARKSSPGVRSDGPRSRTDRGYGAQACGCRKLCRLMQPASIRG
jgi:cytidylate kinase